MTVELAKTEPPGPPSRVGEVLDGRWRLEARLGGGGMGEVYRAVHLSLGRTVAIKVLRAELAGSVSAMRVLREGRAASRVVHPNIVRVEDFGVDGRGLPYLVQELLEGVDLEAYATARRGVVPPGELLPLVIPVLDALAALHEAGILHRDLKPENVFVVREGERWSPRLLDFGLATVIEHLGAEPRITASEVTLGSPAYMSPEQFRDPRSLTPRSDLWSFGAMLYELLSGVLPFNGATVGAVAIMASTQTPVSLGERCPRLPVALVAAVMACLERRPTDRPASARALMGELQRVLDGLAPAATTPRDTIEDGGPAFHETLPATPRVQGLRGASGRRWLTVAAGVVVGLAGLAAWRLPRPQELPAPAALPSTARPTVPVPVLVPVAPLPAPVAAPPGPPPAVLPSPPATRPRLPAAHPLIASSVAPDAGSPSAPVSAPDVVGSPPAVAIEPARPTVVAPPTPTAPLGLGIDPQYR